MERAPRRSRPARLKSRVPKFRVWGGVSSQRVLGTVMDLGFRVLGTTSVDFSPNHHHN